MRSSWAQQRRHSYTRRLTLGCEHSFRRLNQMGRQLFRSLFLPVSSNPWSGASQQCSRRRSSSASCCTWRHQTGATGSQQATAADLVEHTQAQEAAHSFRQQEDADSSIPSHDSNDKMSKLIGLLDGELNGLPEALCSRAAREEPLPELEASWRHFVQLEEQQQATTGTSCQQEAIWELLTTELAYMSRLRLVIDLFQATLVALQQHNLLIEVNGQRVFSNVGQVYAANRAMWSSQLGPMLDRARHFRAPLDATLMRDAFVQTSATFAPYHSYCLQQARSLAYLRHQNRTNELFKVYLAWCESKKECDRLRLADLLAKPTQRLTKYSLLLRAIAKRSQLPEHRTCLQLMVAHMNRFVLAVDLELRRQEEHASLVACIHKLESHYDIGAGAVLGEQAAQLMRPHCRLNLTDPLFGCRKQCQRQLIFDSSTSGFQVSFKDMQSATPHGTEAKLHVTVLLFTDCLLICQSAASSSAHLASYKPKKSHHNRHPKAANSQQTIQHPSTVGQQRGKGVSAAGSCELSIANSSKCTLNGPLSEPLSVKTRSMVLARLSNLRGSNGRSISSLTHLANVPSKSNHQQDLLATISMPLSGAHILPETAPDFELTQLTDSCSASRKQDMLLCIRPPYQLHRLMVHKIKNGQHNKLLFLQLDSSLTSLTSSFVLHFDSASATRSRNKLEVEVASPLNVSPLHQSTSYSRLTSGTTGDQQLLHEQLQETQGSMPDRLVWLIKQAQAKLQLVANFHQHPLCADLFLDESQSAQVTKLSSLATQATGLLPVDGPREWRIEAGEPDSRALIEQHQMLLLNHGLLATEATTAHLEHSLDSSQRKQQQLPARLLSPNRCLVRRCHLNRSARIGAETGNRSVSPARSGPPQGSSTDSSSADRQTLHYAGQTQTLVGNSQRHSLASLRRQNVVLMSVSGEQGSNFRSDSMSTSSACVSSSLSSGWQASSDQQQHHLLAATSSRDNNSTSGPSILCISQATTVDDSTSYAELPSSGPQFVGSVHSARLLLDSCRSQSMDSRPAMAVSGLGSPQPAPNRLHLPTHQSPARSLSSSWMSVSQASEPTTTTCWRRSAGATVERSPQQQHSLDSSPGSRHLLQVPLLNVTSPASQTSELFLSKAAPLAASRKRAELTSAPSCSNGAHSSGYLGFHDKIRLHNLAPCSWGSCEPRAASRRRHLMRNGARRRARRLAKLVHFLLRAASLRSQSMAASHGAANCGSQHASHRTQANMRAQVEASSSGELQQPEDQPLSSSSSSGSSSDLSSTSGAPRVARSNSYMLHLGPSTTSAHQPMPASANKTYQNSPFGLKRHYMTMPEPPPEAAANPRFASYTTTDEDSDTSISMQLPAPSPASAAPPQRHPLKLKLGQRVLYDSSNSFEHPSVSLKQPQWRDLSGKQRLEASQQAPQMSQPESLLASQLLSRSSNHFKLPLSSDEAGLDANRCNANASDHHADAQSGHGSSPQRLASELHALKLDELVQSSPDTNSLLVRFSSIMYATFLVILGCILHVSELRQKSKNSTDHIYTSTVASIGILWLMFLQLDLLRYKRYASKYILIETLYNDQRQKSLDERRRQEAESRSSSSSSASLVNDRMSMNTEVIFKKTAYKMYQNQAGAGSAAWPRNRSASKSSSASLEPGDGPCPVASAAAAARSGTQHHLVPAYKFLHGKMGANFYLKCGMAAFCFGHVIHEGLRFGQQVYFFGVGNVPCKDLAALVAHLITPLYSFYQLFMMFKYSNLVINRHKVLARFGLMHIIGTSVTFWFRTILEEAFEDFVHKMDYFKTNKPSQLSMSMGGFKPTESNLLSVLESITNTIKPAENGDTGADYWTPMNHFTNGSIMKHSATSVVPTTTPSSATTTMAKSLFTLMSSPISATITPQIARHLPDSYACAHNTLLTTKSMNALPYLYPFTIEYNLLLAATFLSLYFNVGKIGHSTGNSCRQPFISYSSYPRDRQKDASLYADSSDNSSRLREFDKEYVGEYKSNFVVNADCHSANKGLFCGFFVLLVTLVTIVIFFVTINKPSHIQLGIKINLIQEATLTSLILIVTLAGLKQMVKLNRNPYLRDKVTTDDVLMLIPLPFFFIHSLLSFRAETASMSSSNLSPFGNPSTTVLLHHHHHHYQQAFHVNNIREQPPAISQTGNIKSLQVGVNNSDTGNSLSNLIDNRTGGLVVDYSTKYANYSNSIRNGTNGILLNSSDAVISNFSQVDHFKLITVALNIIVMIEVLVQTNFIIDGMRRCSESRYLRFKKPGRELITFAILLNITYWIVATFETKSVEQYKTEIEYYGPLPYMFISHTTLPVMLFYRYHSSVCLAEMWNRAYKPPKKR